MNLQDARKRLKTAGKRKRVERAIYYIGDGEQNVDAQSETGEPNTVFIRSDIQRLDFEIAYLDPAQNTRLYFYSTPVDVERYGDAKRWKVIGINTELFNQIYGAGIDTAIGYGGNQAAHGHTSETDGGQLNAGLVFNAGVVGVLYGGSGANLSGTGGANQFWKQTSAGGAVTVAAILSADLTTPLTTPPPIGGTTPSSGAFTVVTASTPIGVASGGTAANLSAAGAGALIQATTGAAVTSLKWNFAGTAAPIVTDDNTAGYAIGSTWLNTTGDKAYDCLDAATGAAVWVERGLSGGIVSFNAAGDSGTPQAITNGNTLTIAGGVGLSSVASATDTVTINLDSPVSVSLGGTGVDKSATGGALQIVKQLSAGAVLTSGVILSAEIASALTTPTAIGSVTPSSGAFTTVTASTPIGVASGGAGANLSGTGGTSFMVKQLSVGAALTTGLITSAEITSALTAPPPIGSVTPNTVAATTVTASTPIGVASGGTGRASVTAEALVKGNGTGALVQITVGANGQMLGVTAGAVGWVTPAAAGMTSFIAAGTSGAAQTISDGNTLTIAAGTGITTTGSATDIITVALVAPVALSNGGVGANLSGTGGAAQFLKQTSVGGAVTVAAILSADLTTPLTTPPPIGSVTPNTVGATALTSTSLTTTVSTAVTNAVVTTATIGVNSTGSAAVGFGGQLRMNAETSTTNDQAAGYINWRWADPTHASKRSEIDIWVANAGGETRIVTITSTGLNNTAIGATTPLNGAFLAVTAVGLTVTGDNISNNATAIVATLGANNSIGTPIANFGGRLRLQAESSTTNDRDAGRFDWYWTTATDASRSSAIDISTVLNAVDTRSATFTPTGINNTVIGATTPSTGRFTGVQAAVLYTNVAYTLTGADYFINVDTGATNKAITLPAAGSHTGRIYYIKKLDAGAGFVVITGTIDGVVNKNLTAKDQVVGIISDGGGWYFISAYP